MGNYSFNIKGLPEPVNGLVEGHNLLRGVPHTKIFEGISGLTFRNCNLTNCDVPADSIIEHCLHIQVSFCSHVQQTWADRGFIPRCTDACSHRTVVDTITIDGTVVDVNHTYEDKEVS